MALSDANCCCSDFIRGTLGGGNTAGPAAAVPSLLLCRVDVIRFTQAPHRLCLTL